jgi:transposase
MYQSFIGIDISKNHFTVGLHGQQACNNFPNNEEGFSLFYESYKLQSGNVLVVLETTGGYEMDLIYYLVKKQIAIHRANTRHVRRFIQSYGKMGKTDAMDALCLALYGSERHAKLMLYKENPHKKLLQLVQRRNDLKAMLVQEKNRLQAPDQHEFRKSFQTMIKAIENEMKAIEDRIQEVFDAHVHFEELRRILKTIKGIGDIIAVHLIALLPELGKINRKQIASLAGLAPHPNESGKKTGYRYTRGGRADIKPVLFLAAMTAARSKSSLGDFYNRLVKAGKKKMVALTALMRKILVIANARIRDHLIISP